MSEDEIVREITRQFPTFGAGPRSELLDNPVARWLQDKPPCFAFGVPVREVVVAVLQLAQASPAKPRPKGS